MSNPLTTHVLNTATGSPAAGLRISLEKMLTGQFGPVGTGVTNDDGRLDEPLIADGWGVGVFRIRFETGSYFAMRGEVCFYPHIEVVFEVRDPEQHHHVPLLLSPFGFSTYRGS